MPVRPQLLPNCATLLVCPDWVAYAAVSAVCLDLRDMHPDGKGPITSAYVSRPTCKAELCRQAGIFGVRPCRVYAGTDTEPLADDEAINLASGCVVTFLQQDVLPNFSNDLQFRLQFPEVWPAAPAFPPPPAPSARLLLHRRGRHLFRLQAGDLPADEAAARFIGVARATVDIYVPAGDGCSSLMHQGVSLRGVLAFVERDTLPVDAAQYIVFLDMRQLALGVKFLTLARPSIPRDQLAALVGRQPPPSWRLRVQGGRMRRDRLDFQTGETLTFGFEFLLRQTLTCLQSLSLPPRQPMRMKEAKAANLNQTVPVTNPRTTPIKVGSRGLVPPVMDQHSLPILEAHQLGRKLMCTQQIASKFRLRSGSWHQIRDTGQPA